MINGYAISLTALKMFAFAIAIAKVSAINLIFAQRTDTFWEGNQAKNVDEISLKRYFWASDSD